MTTEVFIKIFERDLNKLKEEVNAYDDESSLWRVEKGITNSAGNLCLHLTGNLNHFIGAVLGGTGYVRDRASEFASKDVPRQELIQGVENVIGVIRTTLTSLTEKDLAKTYPIEVFGEPMTTAYFITHLTAHLNYHLGQINYHRRLIGNTV